MNPLIVLFVITLAVTNNINVPQVPNLNFRDQEALTWQTFSRFRWWRPRPTFAPAPVVTPERRSVMTPMPAEPIDIHLNSNRSFQPMPTMSSRHDSSSRQGGGESNNSFKAVEREITVLYSAGQPIGPDHLNRLQVMLDVLAKKREASPSDLSRLRSMLDQLDPASRKTGSSHSDNSSGSQNQGGDSASTFKSVEREIGILSGDRKVISPDHYKRLSNSLSDLELKGHNKSEIDKLRKMLQALDPSSVKSTGSSATANQACPSQTNPVLIADITDLSKVKSVTAPGTPSAEGPKGHSFINTDHAWVPIYAPADAVLDSGSYSKDNADSPAQFMLFFNINGSCGFQLKFAHIDEPVEAIKAVLPAIPKVADSRGSAPSGQVEVGAGDLIAYTRGTSQAGNWDFGLYNLQKEGPLAQYGSTGVHRQAVCWVDYYSSAKQAKYRSLLNGTQIVCSYGSSYTTPTPQSSSSGSPVIKNLGVLFGSWDRNTNRAGAFVFTPLRDKIFLEYGAEVPSAAGGTKVLPTFEYYTAADADVFAAVDGEVVTVSYQDRDQDYEILIRPDGAPQWTLGHDHVTNLKISQGSRVKAGDVLGRVGMSNGYGRTEIMLWTSGASAPLTYCPTKFFDAQLRSSLEQKIRQHIKDWEEFKGNSALYNEEKHIFPGCMYESLVD